MLSSDLESPLVPETAVASDFEEPLDVLPKLGFEHVGGHLQVLALLVIALPVEEPPGHTVTLGIVDEVSDGIALGLSQLSGPEFRVESEYLADEEAEPPSDSLDLIEREGDGAFAIDVGVEDTVNMLEGIFCVFNNE